MTTQFGWCLDGFCEDCRVTVGESTCGHGCHTTEAAA